MSEKKPLRLDWVAVEITTAMTLSWITNHSIGWAFVQGLLGWVYTFYWLVKHVAIRYL